VVPELEVATVMVMVLAVTTALELAKVRFLDAVPLINPTVTVTGAAVLNINPVGAVKMMEPTAMPLGAVSDRTGPVSAVQTPLAILLLEMALPPVAAVTFTTGGAASADMEKQTASSAGTIAPKMRIALFIFCPATI